jgi:tetratricopeptide (TPR) repeat protein
MIFHKRSPFVAVAALAILSAVPTASAQQQAQFRALYPSQKASVMQTIGTTDVTITYHRPAVKGRTIFADAPASMEERAKGDATLDNQNERKPGEPIVPYNHVWRAGANEATVFQTTDDVLINGQPLKAGTYGLEAIPGKDDWTIIFNTDSGQWGAFAYDPKKDVLRVKAKPRTAADNQEWLLYTFDPVTANTATVNLRWEKVSVPFTVEVPNVKALWRTKTDALIAANPTNEVFPLQAANVFAADKNWDDALKYVDQSIKVKPTFRNLSARATILKNAGKTQEALAAADQAIAQGKTEGADTSAFEKRVAGWKSGM